jgi:hypothetical protein
LKYDFASDHPVTDDAAKAATGKTLKDWYAPLDARDGLKQGRRAINNFLNEQKLWSSIFSLNSKLAHSILDR